VVLPPAVATDLADNPHDKEALYGV
jgi:hypothetical protein